MQYTKIMRERLSAGDPEFELDPQLRVQAPQIKAALAFWTAKRGDRPMPTRDQFSLRETLGFAPHLQLLDLQDNGNAYRQRLTGTAIVAQLKTDPTGQIFDAASTDPVVHRMLQAVRWVIANRKPLRTVAHRTALAGQDFMKHETLFLPLSSDGSALDMLAVVSDFSAASAPAR
ncbi:MAG TPA: PAS domain-containing protein [Rhizomicrobium sp.]|nr:PAS domain-containing protein [Rhizomicrobium sp.]